MAGKYSSLIKEYCKQHGVSLPAGFERRTASRYAVIVVDGADLSLVATTWYKQADVIYYLEKFGAGRKVRVLDFKDSVELEKDGGRRLRPIGKF